MLQQLDVITPMEEIKTLEEGINYARQQIANVEEVRRDIPFQRPAEQRRLFQVLMMRYGCALGAMAALRLCGKMTEEAYLALRQEAMDLMAPKIIG